MGWYEEGWRQYEWRKKLAEPIGHRTDDQPLWLGEEDIAGKTLFIHWIKGSEIRSSSADTSSWSKREAQRS